VLGLNRYCALLVYSVVGVPVVAAANSGYRFVAVLVSFESDAPAFTVAHELFVPSVVRYLPELLV
jgi:hypothetical protein